MTRFVCQLYLSISPFFVSFFNIDGWLPLACPPPPATDLACNPGMCPDGMELVTLQFAAVAQSTEPHQPGLYLRIF